MIVATGEVLEATTGMAVFYGVMPLLHAIAPNAPELHGGMGEEGRRRRRSEIMLAVGQHIAPIDYPKIAAAFLKGDVPGLQALAALEDGTLSFVTIGKTEVD